MKRITLFLFLVLNSWLCLSVWAQTVELRVDSLDISEFPKSSGYLWVRNPDGIDTSKVRFEENGEMIDVHFTHQMPAKKLTGAKRVVFMLTNGPDVYDFNQNKFILQNALLSGIVEPGDRMDVVAFNCTKSDGEVLVDFPGVFDFTGDAEYLNNKIEGLRYYPRFSPYCVNCVSGLSEINYAVEKVLLALEKDQSTMPTAVIIVGDNQGQRRAFASLTPGVRARLLDVAIYGVTYPYADRLTGHAEDLARETYGTFYNCSTVNEAIQSVISATGEVIKRAQGVSYGFHYKSAYDKDGLSHESKIKYPTINANATFIVNVPEMSMWEWMKNNVIASIIGLVVVLLLLTLIIILLVQQRKMRQREKWENLQKVEDLSRRQAQSNSELEDSRRRMEALQREQQRAQSEVDQQRRDERLKAEHEVLKRQMKERGNFPWFEYSYEGGSGSWEMSKPQITAGRTEGNDWIVPHPAVSRQHLRITFQNYSYELEDLQSSNGVFVNGARVSKRVLSQGDVIEFGGVRATFHI